MHRTSSSVSVSDGSARRSPYESYNVDSKGVLLVSVDFDSCLAGTAFTHRYKQIAHLRDKDYKQYVEEYKKILTEVHPDLINNIMAHAANVEEVIVMIGSNRQLPDIDRSNANNNGNGSCFDGIPILAELLTELMPFTKVSHHPYTLGDSIYNQEPGYTGDVTLSQSAPEAAWHHSKELASTFADVIKDKKYFLMLQQAMMICASRPNASVDMLFFDDLPEVLTVAAHQFSAKGVETALPQNFTSITLNSYEDNSLLAVPNNILEYITHGETKELPEYLVRDCLRLIDVLQVAAKDWIGLSEKHGDQIAALQQRCEELVRAKSAAQLVCTQKTDALIAKYLFSDEKFPAVFDKTVQLVSKSLLHTEKSAALIAEFQRAAQAKDQIALINLLMSPPFQSLIQGTAATAQITEFKNLYRELNKDIRAKNNGILSGYKIELEGIDREYQIITSLLKSFSLCKREHVQALEAAKKYFQSGQTFSLEEVKLHAGAIKQATDFLDAKALTNINVLRDEVSSRKDNMGIDVQSVCDAMLNMASETRQALVRQQDNRLHVVKSVKLNGRFPAHDCAAIFQNVHAHNRYVASCMSPVLWNTDVPAPDISKFGTVFYQSLAIENLKKLLSESPFQEKIASEKRSEGVKQIHQLLKNNPENLPPHELLQQAINIALAKDNPKKASKDQLKQGQVGSAVKSARRTLLVKRKSSDPDNIALYRMLAATDASSPMMLINMKNMHTYLSKNGSKFMFPLASDSRPSSALGRSSGMGLFQQPYATAETKPSVATPKLRKSSDDEDK